MKKSSIMTTTVVGTILAGAQTAFAESGVGESAGLVSIAAGIAIGLPAFGAAFGQSKVVSSTLEAIGRNPGAEAKLKQPMILGLVFIETLVIFSFVIAFFLNNKF